jgi:hypothetical protein
LGLIPWGIVFLLSLHSVGDAAKKNLVELSDVVFFANLNLVAIVVNDSLENGSRLDVLFVADSHESEYLFEFFDESKSRLDTLGMLLVFAFQLTRNFREPKYLGHKVGHRVVHLQQTVKVTRVANVTQTNRVVHRPDALVNWKRLVVGIVRGTFSVYHALLDGFLNLGVIFCHVNTVVGTALSRKH